MVQKARTSLYLDKERIAQLIEEGWNVSALLSEALDLVCTPDWEDMRVMLKIKLMENRREEIDKEISTMRIRFDLLEEEDTRLLKSIGQIKEDWEVAKRTTRLRDYVQSLNRIIIANMYHYPEIEVAAEDIIKRIKELNPDFDLHTHMDRLRVVMEY